MVTPYCECDMGREKPKPRTWKESEIRSRRDLHKVPHGEHRGNKSGMAKTVVDWLLGSGRLPEYRLASKLDKRNNCIGREDRSKTSSSPQFRAFWASGKKRLLEVFEQPKKRPFWYQGPTQTDPSSMQSRIARAPASTFAWLLETTGSARKFE